VERWFSLRRLAQLTGTPLARLQNWRTLGGLLGASCLAGLAAGVALHWSEWPTLARLAAGATVMALAYPLSLYLTGQWGQLTGFVQSLRNKEVKA
jgi:hypothetical protein